MHSTSDETKEAVAAFHDKRAAYGFAEVRRLESGVGRACFTCGATGLPAGHRILRRVRRTELPDGLGADRMNEEPLVLVERHAEQRTALVCLNRPKQLNALNGAVMDALCARARGARRDDGVRAIVVTGNERAFAAGADIGEMADATPIEMLVTNRIGQWDRIRKITKPVIAAVNGWALGGGCELAMTLDLIVAGEGAKFGQPEINIGVIPGAGGTQRLTRAIGKSKAMRMILTGDPITAREAEAAGLVAAVTEDELVVEDALALAADDRAEVARSPCAWPRRRSTPPTR